MQHGTHRIDRTCRDGTLALASVTRRSCRKSIGNLDTNFDRRLVLDLGVSVCHEKVLSKIPMKYRYEFDRRLLTDACGTLGVFFNIKWTCGGLNSLGKNLASSNRKSSTTLFWISKCTKFKLKQNNGGFLNLGAKLLEVP